MIFWAAPPVLPEEEEARRWAEEELSKGIYHGDRESLLEKILNAIGEFFSRAESSSNVPTGSVAIVIVVALLVVLALSFVIYGPLRRARKVKAALHEVLVDDTRFAAELRAAAAAHERAGQWSLAVLERFRALTRSLIERAILPDRPGQTAFEVTRDAGPKLPDAATDIQNAALLFDRVCYGEEPATQAEASWLREIDEQVLITRPNTTAVMT